MSAFGVKRKRAARVTCASVVNDPKATSASPNDNDIIAVFRITRWREGNPYGVITLAEINQPGVSRRASERKQETIWRA